MLIGMDEDEVLQIGPEQGEIEIDSDEDGKDVLPMVKIQKENTELKARMKTLESMIEKMQHNAAAVGDGYYVRFFDYYRFCRMDLKDAALYISDEVKPKIRQIMTKNKAKFQAMILHNVKGLTINMRACTNFNQNKTCNIGRGDTLECHSDKMGLRLHCCIICFETLGSYHVHRARDCQLVKTSYYRDLEAKNY